MKTIKFRAWTQNCWINEGMLYDYQDTTYVESFGFNEEELPLMQFIGLKDKNGKEIYEGDILETTNYLGEKWVFKVEYSEDFAGFMGFDLNTRAYIYHEKDTEHYDFTKSVIVGNIYENPELIA